MVQAFNIYKKQPHHTICVIVISPEIRTQSLAVIWESLMYTGAHGACQINLKYFSFVLF